MKIKEWRIKHLEKKALVLRDDLEKVAYWKRKGLGEAYELDWLESYELDELIRTDAKLRKIKEKERMKNNGYGEYKEANTRGV